MKKTIKIFTMLLIALFLTTSFSCVQAYATNLNGIDISNNDGNINFSQIKYSNIDCIYIKATEGTTFKDPYRNTYYFQAVANGYKVGFYHFLVGTSAPETQADNFWNEIKNKKNDLVPMLDVETNFYGLNDYIQRFINRFEQLSGNMEIGIYSYTSFTKENISPQFANYKFWEANYNGRPWSLRNTFFKNRIGHQYTETGRISGVYCNCDVNVFNEGVFLNNNCSIPSSNSSTVVGQCENPILTLQRELNRQGFRDKNGNTLIEDGIAGELTLSACPMIKQGAEGNLTQWIQLRVGANPDGIYGKDTKQAVKWMQNKWNIQNDGIVGKQTWSKLLGM